MARSPRPDPVPRREAGAAAGLIARADYALYVVTVPAPGSDGSDSSGAPGAPGDGTPSGCLAGFVTQCSIRPPRFLVCISKVNHTFAAAERARRMALHLLGADQADLAAHFGELTGDTTDKFAGCAWHPGATGAPVLDECAAWVEGRVLDHFGVGDHEAFVLSAVAGGTGSRAGQLTLAGAPDLHPGHPPA